MIDNFKNVVARDFFKTFAGEQIGRGCFREVYECRVDTSLVIKIENEAQSFSNVFEWDAWNYICNTDQKTWLAPCDYISPCGTILLQKRTQAIPYEQLPKFVPVWLTDIKPSNWGYYNGVIVCHDYAYNRLREQGLSNKVEKADWD